jgi:hypothetical protein
LVVSLALLREVSLAIDLDNEHVLDGAEVDGIGRDRVLASKLDPIDLSIANPLPYGGCELVRDPSLCASELDGLGGSSAGTFHDG